MCYKIKSEQHFATTSPKILLVFLASLKLVEEEAGDHFPTMIIKILNTPRIKIFMCMRTLEINMMH